MKYKNLSNWFTKLLQAQYIMKNPEVQPLFGAKWLDYTIRLEGRVLFLLVLGRRTTFLIRHEDIASKPERMRQIGDSEEAATNICAKE